MIMSDISNILYLSRGVSLGGSQRQIHYVLRDLDRRRFRPVVVCREPGAFAGRLRDEGIEMHVMRLRPWRGLPGAWLRGLDVRRLATLAKKHNVSLIHCSDLWLGGYSAAAAVRLGVPSVLHVRTPITPDKVRKLWCNKASVLVAISHRIREDLITSGIPSEKITTIYDGVDLDEFRSPAAGPNGAAPGRPACLRQADRKATMVGIVGRITPHKKQLEFVRVAGEVLSACGGGASGAVRFFIIGDVHDRSYYRTIRRTIKSCEHASPAGGLQGAVVFTGPRHDMPRVLASLDILVTLSGGSVMIEAMACGKPVISAGFSRPGRLEIVKDGQTGFVITSHTRRELVEALVKLIRNPELAQRMGEQGRKRAQDLFCHREMVRKTQEVYNRILHTCGG